MEGKIFLCSYMYFIFIKLPAHLEFDFLHFNILLRNFKSKKPKGMSYEKVTILNDNNK